MIPICQKCGKCCNNTPLMEEWELPRIMVLLEEIDFTVEIIQVGPYWTFKKIDEKCPLYDKNTDCRIHTAKPGKCEALLCKKCFPEGISVEELERLNKIRLIECGITI